MHANKFILIGERSVSGICLFWCFKWWTVFCGDVEVVREVLLCLVYVERNENRVFLGVFWIWVEFFSLWFGVEVLG